MKKETSLQINFFLLFRQNILYEQNLKKAEVKSFSKHISSGGKRVFLYSFTIETAKIYQIINLRETTDLHF